MKDLLGMGHLAWDRFEPPASQKREVGSDRIQAYAESKENLQLSMQPVSPPAQTRSKEPEANQKPDQWWEAVCDRHADEQVLADRGNIRRDVNAGKAGGSVARASSAPRSMGAMQRRAREAPQKGYPAMHSPAQSASSRGGYPQAAPATSLAFGSRVPTPSKREACNSPSIAGVGASPSQSSRSSRSGSTPVRLSSSRFDSMRVAPPFGKEAGRESRFAMEYARRTLPCHIDHRTSSNQLSWDVPIEEVLQRRAALLPLCADGLRETRHPHATVARLAFRDLATLDNAEPLDDEVMRRVMAGLRLALLAEGPGAAVASRSPQGGGSATIFESALAAVRQIAVAEGERIVPHLHLILPPIGKKMFSKLHRESVQDTLRTIEHYGGREAASVMRHRGVQPGVA